MELENWEEESEGKKIAKYPLYVTVGAATPWSAPKHMCHPSRTGNRTRTTELNQNEPGERVSTVGSVVNSRIKRRKIDKTNAVTGEIIHKFRERFTGIDFMRIAKIRLAIMAFSNTGIRIKGRGGVTVTGEVNQKRFLMYSGKGFSSFKKARLSYSSVPKSLVATFTNTII